jgi:enhancing lycopene biosynthesis protein 2
MKNCIFGRKWNVDQTGPTMKKFAVIISGCGVFDGAEIHEAVLTLLAIDRQGAAYQVFAPDIDQYHVVNHFTGQVMPEKRNVLVEAARIARGEIRSLKDLDASAFDAIIIPGGFGAAKNLCSWAYEGDACKVNPDVEKAIRTMLARKKPVGAMCIAPVLLAKILSGTNLTTGQDKSSQGFIEKMGSRYTPTHHGEVVIDEANMIFSTPCYMLDATISQVAEGADNIVREMLKRM